MLGFALKYWKYFALVGIILGAYGGLRYYGSVQWHAGYNAAMQEFKDAQEDANQKVITQKKVIKHETSTLDRAGIIKQLCDSQWVRTPKDCPK